jgi:hypothetical protein
MNFRKPISAFRDKIVRAVLEEALMPEAVVPRLGAESFSCPHCGAISHQNWYKLFLSPFRNEDRPSVLSRAGVLGYVPSDEDEVDAKSVKKFQERFKKNEVTYDAHRYSVSCEAELVNTWASQCYSCQAFSFWIKDKISHPVTGSDIKPHEDMPIALRDDFEEAVSVIDLSPRSSAALLRLCIQNLMKELNQKGQNLNSDIGALVAQGLDPGVQKALDVVRVVGNNAVHPGQIDLKDDKAAAMSLFQLLNVIIERCISIPKKIEAMYAGLPPGALEAIEKRDKG